MEMKTFVHAPNCMVPLRKSYDCSCKPPYPKERVNEMSHKAILIGGPSDGILIKINSLLKEIIVLDPEQIRAVKYSDDPEIWGTPVKCSTYKLTQIHFGAANTSMIFYVFLKAN